MRIELAYVVFEASFAQVSLEDGRTLCLNAVDEEPEYEGVTQPFYFVNVEVWSEDEEVKTRCTNIIGVTDSILTLGTDYPEYEGQRLTPSNISYAWIDIDTEEEEADGE